MSIVNAKGYKCGYAAVGFKHKGRNDMALIVSDVPAVCAGVFTKNVVKAAPVLWDQAVVASGEKVKAIIVNSGIANACTGAQGDEVCKKSAQYLSQMLDCKDSEILIASTGVIGKQMPMDKIYTGVDMMKDNINSSRENATLCAKAIMTTDTKPKEVEKNFMIGDTKVSIGGMAKGSGMIHPNMGTMLSFITCDIDISKELLQEALLEVAEDTYNMISVDGDTSTNDSCMILANGLAGNKKITEKNEDYEIFKLALLEINEKIAKMMAGDGEGATALVETKVIGAKTKSDAKILAKSVISSSLTKAAIFGHDANWGRILCALGYSGVEFDPYLVDVSVASKDGEIKLVENGLALDYSEEKASEILGAEEVYIICDIKQGNEEACAWGCDLTYDYVKINADYRS